MTDNTQPEAGSTHIIRYALEMGLLWIDGDGRDKVREALDALDTLEAQLEAIGAGGVSGPLMGRASLSANAGDPVAWQGVHDQTDLYYTKPLQADVRPLYAAPQPAPVAQGDALNNTVRVPLDSLHADAAYLIGRLQLDTMDGARVVEIIRERIEAAKAALAAQAQEAAPVAQGDARAEQALLKVLAAVQRYLPPDGPSAKDTLSEIIGIVDPWPLGDLKGKA